MSEARLLWPRIVWREQNGEHWRMGLGVDDELCWFEGHFPGLPILPGVVQIHWAALLFLREYDDSLLFQRMEAVKFRELLLPGREVTLDLAFDVSRSRLAFRYLAEASVFSSGRIYWTSP